ncbi:MAG TPA: hypothetical protein VME86_10320 [Acidobacteriaceae bacterium]|nr:hypothetical protein [Acidobacteriaceae bacterium]
MSKIAFSVLWVLIIVVAFAAINGMGYVRYFLPPGFRGATYWTYLPLMVSTSCAALIGGCVGYHVPWTGKLPVKIGSGICYAVAVAILVFNLSMLIIVNVRGE